MLYEIFSPKQAKWALQTRESKESSCNAGLEAATDSETPEQLPQDHLHLTPHLVSGPYRCGSTQLGRKQQEDLHTIQTFKCTSLPLTIKAVLEAFYRFLKLECMRTLCCCHPTAEQSLLFQLEGGISPSQYVSSFHRVLEQQV